MRKNKISTLVFGKFRKIAVNSFHHFKSHNRIKSFQGVAAEQQVFTRCW